MSVLIRPQAVHVSCKLIPNSDFFCSMKYESFWSGDLKFVG